MVAQGGNVAPESVLLTCTSTNRAINPSLLSGMGIVELADVDVVIVLAFPA